ncbi:hypothetical protein [Borreliella kurtenbachii]|uniref:hypothetical protein n=1 Tax=Borreliella kurtenbachii TaxID=1196056 RepID=UPI00346309CE
MSAVGCCILDDIKIVIHELKNNLFESSNKDLDEFLMSLGRGSNAKKLINLFRKIKTRLGYNFLGG